MSDFKVGDKVRLIVPCDDLQCGTGIVRAKDRTLLDVQFDPETTKHALHAGWEGHEGDFPGEQYHWYVCRSAVKLVTPRRTTKRKTTARRPVKKKATRARKAARV